MGQVQLNKVEVRKLFTDYDALSDVKAAKSKILQKIHDGFGAGPFTQGDDRFKIVKRKINGTEDYRYILRFLESEAEDTSL